MGQDGSSGGNMSGTIKILLAAGATTPGELLPMLHKIQDTIGFIPAESIGDIAGSFNLSRAEVHGVVTFYHHFRTTPPALHQIQICRAEACQSMGGEQLAAHASKALGCEFHGKSADGKFGLEPVYCLGQCATSPAMMINDDIFARVTAERFDKIVAQLAEEKP